MVLCPLYISGWYFVHCIFQDGTLFTVHFRMVLCPLYISGWYFVHCIFQDGTLYTVYFRMVLCSLYISGWYLTFGFWAMLHEPVHFVVILSFPPNIITFLNWSYCHIFFDTITDDIWSGVPHSCCHSSHHALHGLHHPCTLQLPQGGLHWCNFHHLAFCTSEIYIQLLRPLQEIQITIFSQQQLSDFDFLGLDVRLSVHDVV